MNEFEVILDDCLNRMSAQGDSIAQCLARYPQEANQLRPLLEAAARMGIAKSVVPSFSFKGSTKAKLMAHAEARPRRVPRFLHPVWRLTAIAAALAIVVVFSTTAFAQAALPGEALYAWKLRSEEVWRVVAADRVGVDLSLVDRRATELARVASDPTREVQVRDEFHEVLIRLAEEQNSANGPRIQQALIAHQKKLQQAGIRDKELDELVHGHKPH